MRSNGTRAHAHTRPLSAVYAHTRSPLEHRCAARLYGCCGLTERSRTVSAHQRPWLKVETRRMRSSSCGPWVALFSFEFLMSIYFQWASHETLCVYHSNASDATQPRYNAVHTAGARNWNTGTDVMSQNDPIVWDSFAHCVWSRLTSHWRVWFCIFCIVKIFR